MIALELGTTMRDRELSVSFSDGEAFEDYNGNNLKNEDKKLKI